MGKKKTSSAVGRALGGGGRRSGSGLGLIGMLAAACAVAYFIGTLYLKKAATPLQPSKRPTKENPMRQKSKPERATRTRPSASVEPRRSMPNAQEEEPSAKRESLEWTTLPRSLPDCLVLQKELMTTPVEWPGFHAFCIDELAESHVSLRLHGRSGAPRISADNAPSTLKAMAMPGQLLIEALMEELKAKLLPFEFQEVDPMVSTSAYDFPPNPWALYTQVGGPVEADDDLHSLGPGAALWLYTGGAFIWPGVRMGHKTVVPIPVTDGSSGGHKLVEMTTVSLRPTVLVLNGFLTPEECDFIKSYASSRMVPSGLAMMDSSGDSTDVRTSTQTFMERGGSRQIRALEERAHNLTRLPYNLGENIQVVRYTKGQKYGAHRDFFNPNDYHRQPHMLRSVEYGARNRLATVFWYLETVSEGGETFFPRALNEQGKEYHRWNGDHEDCYRGIYVPPVRGNAVLFYSMVPDGRLDERALHGGCKPRAENVEKWGANQWIWNHPQRHSGSYPKRGMHKSPRGKAGCSDSDPNCIAWAASGECTKNKAFMLDACKLSCGKC